MKQKMKQIRPTLTPELHEWLVTYAKLTGRSCSSVIRIAFIQYQERHAKELAQLQARSKDTPIEKG